MPLTETLIVFPASAVTNVAPFAVKTAASELLPSAACAVGAAKKGRTADKCHGHEASKPATISILH